MEINQPANTPSPRSSEVTDTDQRLGLAQPQGCSCSDWKLNIDKVNGPIVLQSLRAGADLYTGKPFTHCPWCGSAIPGSGPVEARGSDERTQFDDLFNAFKAASQSDYAEHRCALFAYVRDLEARCAAAPVAGDEIRKLLNDAATDLQAHAQMMPFDLKEARREVSVRAKALRTLASSLQASGVRDDGPDEDYEIIVDLGRQMDAIDEALDEVSAPALSVEGEDGGDDLTRPQRIRALAEMLSLDAQSGGIPRETPSALDAVIRSGKDEYAAKINALADSMLWSYCRSQAMFDFLGRFARDAYATSRSRSESEPSAPAVVEAPGPQITAVAWRDEWGYGVRACRGHWHIIGILEDGTEGEDLAIDGDPFATQQEAIDAAKAWCAKHSTRATPVSTENER